MMNWMLRNCARALTFAGLLAVVMSATAQAQTPEGTVITNTATVTWTDANGNPYAPVSGSVNVTVGFTAGIDVIAGAATVNPASPSAGNSISFTIQNIGNGDDSVAVDTSFTTAGVVTVTGWLLNATPYGDLTALNAALSTTLMIQNATITVEMQFDVNAAQGGNSVVYTLTANSRRTPTTTDSDVTTISPPAAYAVQVTPNPVPDRLQIPGTYTVTFTVENTGNINENFDLNASNVGLPDNFITIVSVDGVIGSSTQINLNPTETDAIIVEYTIAAAAAAGAIDSLSLVASSAVQPATLDESKMQVEVLRAVVTVTKQAFADQAETALGATVVPGQTIWYKITVTNTGIVDAESVHLNDDLPNEVTLQSTAPDVPADWTIVIVGDVIDADLDVTLATGSSRVFWIEVQIN